MIEISDEYMSVTIDGATITTARWSWIASTHPKRLFSRDQATSAMVLASLLASGRADDDPHVISLRKELKW